MHSPHADVAELADAQVSEACDGDIVEVQVLSSAPIFQATSECAAVDLEFGIAAPGTRFLFLEPLFAQRV